jgi:hypothetical protein
MESPRMKPGDLAREYAARNGWSLLSRNVMVEGETDVGYLNLAAELYRREKNLELLGNDLSIFACGSGNLGGTYGIYEQLPPLLNIIRSDPDPNGKMLFRVIALVDNDKPGRSLQCSIIKQYRNIRANRDIFCLNYIFPRTATEPNALTSQITKYNTEWKGLDCEIEDLIGNELIELFIEESPNSLLKGPFERHNKKHYEWTNDGKARLFQFVNSMADFNSVQGLIELLKSLRFYLGLPADG